MNPFEKVTKSESEPKLRESRGIESIQKTIEAEAVDHYLYTHLTEESIAKKIFYGNFEVSMGSGISGSLTFTGASGALIQIQKILAGESPHRGYTGMLIIAIPKNIFPEHGENYKYTNEKLEDYLVESNNYINGKYVIPQEYNFAYLQGDILFSRSK
jgi:hypothetical protein